MADVVADYGLRARRAPTSPRDADATRAVAVIDRALTPIRNSKTT